MNNSKYGTCKYCHKPLKKIKCPEYPSTFYWLSLFMDIWIYLVYITYLIVSHINKNIDKKDLKNKIIITCNNRDCINYLSGCYPIKKVKV